MSISYFYRLQPERHYAQIMPDSEGYYQTPLLPKLKIHIPTLYQAELPNMFEVIESVKAMVEET
jgi:hypothetical protein